MKFTLKINGTEDPKAAYVGWTPVKCTLTIEDYSGELPMPVTITTGNDGFEGQLSLYKSNATTAQPVDNIQHNFQTVGELNFYIAGKYPHASVARKDTFVQVTADSGAIEPLKSKVMVRVRKNANTLSQEEINIFLECFARLNVSPTRGQYDEHKPFIVKPGKLLHEIVLMHTMDASYEIHGRTSFHPWHRAFQMHLERELQEIDPRVTIPYWKFDEKAGRVFTRTFIGETPQSGNPNLGPAEGRRPVFAQTNPLFSYVDHTVWGPLRRAYRAGNPATRKPANIYPQSIIIDHPQSPASFIDWAGFEEGNSHNPAHSGFTGHVVDIGKDPADPLFFMMHGNVDRLWALWQKKHNKFNSSDPETYPFPGSYTGKRGDDWAADKQSIGGYYPVTQEDIGNFADDTLWPWNLDTTLSRPTRKWTGDEPGDTLVEVPQIAVKFPVSATSNYPEGEVTVKSTIDYQGRINNQTILGFDYDTIPYFAHDPATPQNVVMEESTEDSNEDFHIGEDKSLPALATLTNRDASLAARLASIESIDKTSEAFLDASLTVIANAAESTELRSGLIHEVFAAKRFNRHFFSYKPRFFDILRGLIRSDDQQLRFQAIDILAASEDAVVQDFLIEELEKSESEFISKQDAIFFLRQNTKPQHAKLFRELFEKSEDPDVKKAALEGLDNDPASTELLTKVVLDENESFKVREAGALSLHHIDHEAMNNLAAQIISTPVVANEGVFLTAAAPDPDEINFKAGLLNMLTFTGNINQLKQNEDLKTSLEKAADTSAGNKTDQPGLLSVTAETPGTGPGILEQLSAKLLNKFNESATDDQQ